MYNIINEIEKRISNMYRQLQELSIMDDEAFENCHYEKSIYESFLVECINMHYEKIKSISNCDDKCRVVDFGNHHDMDTTNAILSFMCEDDNLINYIEGLLDAQLDKLSEDYEVLLPSYNDSWLKDADKTSFLSTAQVLSIDDEVKCRGEKVVAQGKTAVLLLAGGAGTRVKNSIIGLKKYISNKEDGNHDESYDELESALNKSSLLENLDEDIPKFLQPMTAVSNKSSIQENLESISQIAGENKSIPVMIVVNESSRDLVSGFLKDNNSFGLSNIILIEQDDLPFIDQDSRGLLRYSNGELMVGSNGGGGALLALGNSYYYQNGKREESSITVLDRLLTDGYEKLIVVQSDDAKNPNVYLNLLGTNDSQNDLSVLGYSYPLNKKEDGDFSYRLGSLWNYHGDKNYVKCTEFADLSDTQRDMMKNRSNKDMDNYLIANSGSYIISLPFTKKIIDDRLLLPHLQKNKTVVLEGSEHTVTKFEYFIPDIIKLASLHGENVKVLTLNQYKTREGEPFTPDSIPIKDISKLIVAQDAKSLLSRLDLHDKGIEVGESTVVEVGNNISWGSIGNNIKVLDEAMVYFGGSNEGEYTVTIGDNIEFKDNIKVLINGTRNITIKDNVIFSGSGTIVIAPEEDEDVIVDESIEL